MKNSISHFTILILAAAGVTACHTKGKTTAAIPPMNVETAIATTRNVSDKIWFATSTEPIRSVTIEPRVNGYLSTIDYIGGSEVKQGDIIFTIDPSQINTELYAAEAAVESARATFVEAYNNYQRAIPLAKIDAISRSSLDQYTAEYRSAEAAVKSAEQSLNNARLNTSYTIITAPIDGIIADSPASVGDLVGIGTLFSTLTTIEDIDTLKVQLAIPAAKYLRHNDSKPLLSDIRLILPDSTLYPYPAIYDYTQQSGASSSSTVVVVANIPNPDLSLKNGMFARLRSNIGVPRERVVIPQRAVTQMQGESSVWVINPDSTASFRRIKLGNTDGNEWCVESGLSAGEMVATTAQIKLHQGAKVSPTNR